MREQFSARMLRVYFNERDRWNGKRLDETILEECGSIGLAGAIAYRGMEGFGASAAIHRESHLSRTHDSPMMVTIIDRPEQIEKLIPILDRVLQEGLVAMSSVEVIRLTRDEQGG
jgi:PII-like signaling protein